MNTLKEKWLTEFSFLMEKFYSDGKIRRRVAEEEYIKQHNSTPKDAFFNLTQGWEY
jgi:hypothetical protein